VLFVKAGDEAPELIFARGAVKGIQVTTADVAAGIARDTKNRQQRGIDKEHDRTNSQAEPVGEPKRIEDIPPEKSQDNQREIEKVTMHILEQERKACLAAITFRCIAHGTRGRR